jgi:CrcB protein
MLRPLLVGVGGFIGALSRYWLAGACQRVVGVDFPFGTLSVNIVGSFVLGLVMAAALERNLIGPDLRIFVTVGFCGGLTTMSTFSYETLALLRDGSWLGGIGNAALSLVGCLAAVWLGDTVARLL